ncbi:Protein srg1 [Ranunculus cassubicifolius]
MWIPIKPLPNAFIVNVGDILEIISNGTYRSIEHCSTVNNVKERLSIATFHNPSYDSEFGPLRSLVTQSSPALFKSITTADYIKGVFERRLAGKSYIDEMKIGNEKDSI